jgi:hypothetical protein
MSKPLNRWIEYSLKGGAALVALALLIQPLAAAPEDEVRTTFERFVAAQNAHDIKSVQALLLDSPDFLWITRGTPVWGVDAAMKRFTTLYQGDGTSNRKPSVSK